MIVWHYEFWTGHTWHCNVCGTICGGALISVRRAADEHVCPEWATHDIGIDKNPSVDNDQNRARREETGTQHATEE